MPLACLPEKGVDAGTLMKQLTHKAKEDVQVRVGCVPCGAHMYGLGSAAWQAGVQRACQLPWCVKHASNLEQGTSSRMSPRTSTTLALPHLRPQVQHGCSKISGAIYIGSSEHRKLLDKVSWQQCPRPCWARGEARLEH